VRLRAAGRAALSADQAALRGDPHWMNHLWADLWAEAGPGRRHGEEPGPTGRRQAGPGKVRHLRARAVSLHLETGLLKGGLN